MVLLSACLLYTVSYGITGKYQSKAKRNCVICLKGVDELKERKSMKVHSS